MLTQGADKSNFTIKLCLHTARSDSALKVIGVSKYWHRCFKVKVRRGIVVSLLPHLHTRGFIIN